MTYFLALLQRCIDLTDNTVFRNAEITESVIDIRTLMCFALFAVFLLSGIGIVGFLESELIEFCVWVVVSTPLALVFAARHQRLKSIK